MTQVKRSQVCQDHDPCDSSHCEYHDVDNCAWTRCGNCGACLPSLAVYCSFACYVEAHMP